MMNHILRQPASLLAILALAACSPAQDAETTLENMERNAAEAPADGDDNQADAAAALPVAEGNTIGGDGSQIVLATLSAADIDGAKLDGELACSFGDPGAAPILIARGNVGSSDRAQGVVKVSSYVEEIGAPGGYNGMLRGATFAGKGKTIVIKVGDDKPGSNEESPPIPATLTYQRADGASRTYAGSWTCGP